MICLAECLGSALLGALSAVAMSLFVAARQDFDDKNTQGA
jgi:hypothetical protein